MPTVELNYRGSTYEANVPESFFSLSDEEQKKKLISLVGAEEPEEEGGGFLETAKDVGKKVGGGVLTGLHQLGRPQSAVAGGLFNIQEELMGKGGDENRSTWERYVLETVEGMKKGFTYEDEKRMQDLIAQAHPDWVKENPILSTIAGFAGDVVSDPLNLLGIGLVRKAVALPIKGISKAMEGTAAGAALINAADNPILRAFNVYAGDKKVAREIYVRMLDDVRGTRGLIGRAGKIEKNALKESAKKLGVSVDDLYRQVLREAEGAPSATFAMGGSAIDVPADLTGAARAKAVQEAEDMKVMFGDFLAAEKADVAIAGGGVVKGSTVEDIMRPGREAAMKGEDLAIEGYVPHILLQARKAGRTLRDQFRRHPHMNKRGIPGTVEDANIQYGKNFFLTDVTDIKGIRAASHAQVVAGKNFLKETAENLGRRVDDAPAHWVPIEGVEGVLFDPHHAEFIRKMHRTMTDPEELNKFLKMMDGATNWWKTWSLGLRPAYHSRNVVGNIWNSYNIGGMGFKDARWFGKAINLQKQATVTGKGLGKLGFGNFKGSTKLGKYGTVSNDELYRMAMKDGILNHGQYGADIGRNLERYAAYDTPQNAAQRLAAWVTPSSKNKLLQGGFATGRALENNSRLALYMHTLSKTGSRKAARANVKKSLFDYSDLSSFEQNVMKRLIPFYTWSRKNIPAQIEALVKNPQRAARVGHLIDNIQYGIDTPPLEEVNEFIRKRDPVFIDKFYEGGGGDVHNVITLMNYLPLTDIDRLLDWKPIREGETMGSGTPFPTLIAEMTNPFLKSIVEYTMNYDIYRRRDIRDYPHQQVDFVGVRMPVHLAKLAQNLVMLSEFDRLNPNGMFGERTRDAEGIETRTQAKFKPPWQEEATTRQARLDQPMSHRFLQYLVGLRPYEVKEDAKMFEQMRVFRDYEELINRMTREAGKRNVDNVKDIEKAMEDIRRVMEGL